LESNSECEVESLAFGEMPSPCGHPTV